jgi:ferric-dicitrate binding protein FerR (iron transport regulator)
LQVPSPYPNDALLVKFLLGEANSMEIEEAANWIGASRENEQYFHELRQVWCKSNPVEPVEEINEHDAWHRFKQNVTNENKQQQKAAVPPKNIFELPARQLLQVAAILLIAICTMGIAYFMYNRYNSPEILQISAKNNIQNQQLADGSTVLLNKHSSLFYPVKFKGNQREVKLQGEAFFSIQPDKSKPFRVKVNELTISVVGTSFNIKELNGKTEVIVETGIVEVSRRGRTIVLHPKEKISIGKDDSSFTKEMEADQLYNYYRTKNFTCDNTPLWKLVEVLNEAYGSKISINNNAIRNLPLTTTFEEESLDNILNIIAQTLSIRIVKLDGQILLQ